MSFPGCMPTRSGLHLVDSDGALVDDPTDEEVIAYLLDGVVTVTAQRVLSSAPLACDVACVEWHTRCDPDECPLGARGFLPDVIDCRDHRLQVARDAAIEGRTVAALALVREYLDEYTDGDHVIARGTA